MGDMNVNLKKAGETVQTAVSEAIKTIKEWLGRLIGKPGKCRPTADKVDVAAKTVWKPVTSSSESSQPEPLIGASPLRTYPPEKMTQTTKVAVGASPELKDNLEILKQARANQDAEEIAGAKLKQQKEDKEQNIVLKENEFRAVRLSLTKKPVLNVEQMLKVADNLVAAEKNAKEAEPIEEEKILGQKSEPTPGLRKRPVSVVYDDVEKLVLKLFSPDTKHER